ncbi:MAG: threonine synthase [Pseudomonadota bacterium]
MRYISTRGQAEPVGFLDACLSGLAPDGGLYVPETFPQLAPAAPNETYIDLATRVLKAFAGDDLPEVDVRGLCSRAYGRFAHSDVAPLVAYGPNHWLMELHHGPTLAFKDVAMQVIGELYGQALERRGQTMSIVCATSGDTGGAAAAAFAGQSRVNLTILHPHGRISPVQRLFMTTTGAENVQNLALNSDFDTCQAFVKSMFADTAFAGSVGLSGVNSINWARIAAQSVYYASAQRQLGPARPIRFVVPTGNMGDALAGYVAARCGLLAGLDVVCAVNDNRALADVFEIGRMVRTETTPTPSPAMDITVPSNLERLLFEVSGRDGDAVTGLYQRFAQAGEVDLPETIRGPLGCTGLAARSVTATQTGDELTRFHADTGWLICPHTAVGTAVARTLPETDAATVVLATAHPAKFPETVEAVTGHQAPLPERCDGLRARCEVYSEMDADLGAVKAAISGRTTAQAGAG